MDPVDAPPVARRALARLSGVGTFSSLSLPQFRLLLAGTATSQVAGWMEQVARGWLVLELTHSPFQLGLFEFIRGFSGLAVSPVAGVLADRLDRRRLAAITQVTGAIIAIIVGLLVATGHIALWHLYMTTAVAGIANAVNMPTRQVLVYDVVGPDHLSNAIALNSVTANVARIAAPSVGGVVIGAAGVAEAFYTQTAFLLLATAATLSLRTVTDSEPVRVPIWQGLREGAQYVRGDPTVLRLVLLNLIPAVLIYPYVGLMPVFADEVLGGGSAGYGLLLTGVGFGSIPGGLLVASMSRSRRRGLLMGGSALLYMGAVALFALSSWFALSFALLVVGGLGWSMMVTLNQTLLQLHLASAFRGRVLAFYSMANGLTPFGSLSMGAAADRYGVQTAVATFALIAFALAAYAGLGSRRVRRL